MLGNFRRNDTGMSFNPLDDKSLERESIYYCKLIFVIIEDFLREFCFLLGIWQHVPDTASALMGRGWVCGSAVFVGW